MIPGTTDQFDITINDIGLMIDRDYLREKGIQGGFIAAVEGEQQHNQDISVEWKDFSKGAFHSRNVDGSAMGGYDYGEFVCTRYPGAVTPAGLTEEMTFESGVGGVTASFEIGGHLWLATGLGYILKLPARTGTPSIVNFFSGYSFTDAVMFNGKIYLSAWDGTTVKDMVQFDGTTWSILAGIPAFRLAVVHWFTADNIPLLRLIRADTTTSLKHLSLGANPATAGDWSAAITIGDDSFRINKLLASSEHVYALKPDGVWDITSFGESRNLSSYWGDVADADSGQTGAIYDGRLVAAHIMGLDSVGLTGASQDETHWCQPGHMMANETVIQGRITAVLEINGYLAAMVGNPNNGNSYLMYGMQVADRNGLSSPMYVWHGAECVIEGSADDTRYITHMCTVSPADQTQPAYLYLFSTNSTLAKFHRQSMPRNGSPVSDWQTGGPHRFHQAGTLHLPWESLDSPASPKYPWRYEIAADNVQGSRQIELYADYDRTGPVLQGSSSETRVGFNVAADEAVYSIGHDVELMTNNTEEPAILRSVNMRAILAIDQFDVREYPIMFGAGTGTRSGDDPRDSSQIRAEVFNLMIRGAVTMRDEEGQTLTVKVLQGIPYTKKMNQTDQRAVVASWNVPMLLRVRVLAREARYDDGFLYDTDAGYAA